ncbi:hypothetical protein DR864_05455 [Runella rosea]|uniref:Uncharacterized protein n=1 Tax=Runella rosea TaxID=2259595 RepID=A0A344TEZ7_9BACT|nr:hypothetical protein [Runella rosea]AXE17218.1 hypothetical protein DR864_05455 [Runella rosea]
MTTNQHKKSGETVFYEFFLTHVTSIYDFEKQTGISRADGCRYKSKYEKLGLLQVVQLGICPISRERNVQFVTTDKRKFLKPIQLPINFSQPQL